MQRYLIYTFCQLDSRYMLMFLSNISLELHYSHPCLEFKRTGYGGISVWYACLSSTEKLLCTENEKLFKMKARTTELTSYSGLLQPCKTVIKIWQLKIKLSLLYSYKNIKGEWNEKIHYLFCSIHYLLLTIHYLLRVWRHVLSPPLGYKNFPQFPPELPFDLVTFTLFPT